MPRGKSVAKREIAPDAKYGHLLLAKFINMVMQSGKKSAAQEIVYGALEKLQEVKKADPIKLFEQILDLIRPGVEVRSRRVGGANYQVPVPDRKSVV